MPPETSPINDAPAPVARPTDGLVYVSGAWRTAAEASVSVFDHGLLYGDGVFEGIRAYNGRVFKLERHIDRLFDSAKAIRLEIPQSHAEVCELVVETCRRNAIADGYVRLRSAQVPARRADRHRASVHDVHGRLGGHPRRHVDLPAQRA
jgi:branched-subunit amino acid aminotransferase/4-amino-4-deoxychorismate lyase